MINRVSKRVAGSLSSICLAILLSACGSESSPSPYAGNWRLDSFCAGGSALVWGHAIVVDDAGKAGGAYFAGAISDDGVVSGTYSSPSNCAGTPTFSGTCVNTSSCMGTFVPGTLYAVNPPGNFTLIRQ